MESLGARPVVLVVEDEAVIRHAAVEMIEAAGFAVAAAKDGTSAMQMLESYGTVRAVFTDIDMPQGIDGIRLAACIDRRWPEVGIVVTSGKRAPSPGDIPPRHVFFAKPYDEAAVVAAITTLVRDYDLRHAKAGRVAQAPPPS